MFATLIVAKVQSLGHVIMNKKTKIDSNMITETGKRMAMCKKKDSTLCGMCLKSTLEIYSELCVLIFES